MESLPEAEYIRIRNNLNEYGANNNPYDRKTKGYGIKIYISGQDPGFL